MVGITAMAQVVEGRIIIGVRSIDVDRVVEAASESRLQSARLLSCLSSREFSAVAFIATLRRERYRRSRGVIRVDHLLSDTRMPAHYLDTVQAHHRHDNAR